MHEEKIFQFSSLLKSCINDGKREVKTATLSNDDIPRIINGCPNDPIEKNPFSLCDTLRKIFNSWTKVCFAPFTRNSLTHKKNCHTLSESGASIDMAAKLKIVKDSTKG